MRAVPSVAGRIAGEDPHRRGLAGAVRAEKADDLTSLDVERDAVHGHQVAVALGDVVGLDHVPRPELVIPFMQISTTVRATLL